MAGHRDAFALLEREGAIEALDWVSPKTIAAAKGHSGALREIHELIEARKPDVIVALTPSGFLFTEEWIRAVSRTSSAPVLLYWEGDAWGRLSKPPPKEVRLWWREADVAFTVALGPQRSLMERHGARDVRFVPQTYDHVRFGNEEANEPPTHGAYSDVVLIANWWGNRYFSRLPGGGQRRRLVRKLQKDMQIPLVVYGSNWTGRGARGSLAFAEQAAAARRGLLTATWDFFPSHAAYSSNRLPIALIAGRAHVTTLHPGADWLPGPESGLFQEPTVDAAFERVRDLLARPREEVLALGLAAHRWARHRLSDREMARYVLGAVDVRLLEPLPADPWSRLPT